MADEIWKYIGGYEGDYQVSNLGRVKSYKRKIPIILRPKIDKDGYEQYALSKDGIPRSFRGHRLVAFAFIPLIQGKDEIHHKNAIKNDNRVENLSWVTSKENQLFHYYDEDSTNKKYNDDRKIQIACVELGVVFDSLSDAIKTLNELGISKSTHSGGRFVKKSKIMNSFKYCNHTFNVLKRGEYHRN